MAVINLLIVLFVLSLLFTATVIFRSEQEELKKNKRKILPAAAGALVLALLPTAALAFLLFALLGSGSAANYIFSLGISLQQLMLLTVFIFIYWWTADSVIEKVVTHGIGTGKRTHIMLLLTRIFAFYVIGSMLGLSQTGSFLIAVSVSALLLLMRLFFEDILQKNQA